MEETRSNIEPFVSVVTPVYNGEKYLVECIESVLYQTYDNWEYVIVNNCSTDKTLEIAKKYARQDSRIHIYNNKEHLLVMANLNHAFRQISPESKYCKVIHADDWMFPECISRMVELAEDNPNVGIVNSYYLENDIVCPRGIPYPSRIIDGRELSRKFLLDKGNYFGAPSNLLIRSSLINKREQVYDETYLESDLSACLDMLSESDFGFVHQVLTYTRRHDECLTNAVAKRDYTYMFGDLKIRLDYGRMFLSEKRYSQLMKQRENIFYILFARRLLMGGDVGEEFKRHLEELRSINYKMKYSKLLKYFIRESVLKMTNKTGIEINRRKNGQAVMSVQKPDQE